MTERARHEMRESRGDLRLQLHLIDQELDRTAPWESPPYRNDRRRLNRRRESILRRLQGDDPLFSVDRLQPHQRCYSDLTDQQKRQYRMRKSVDEILQTLNP